MMKYSGAVAFMLSLLKVKLLLVGASVCGADLGAASVDLESGNAFAVTFGMNLNSTRSNINSSFLLINDDQGEHLALAIDENGHLCVQGWTTVSTQVISKSLNPLPLEQQVDVFLNYQVLQDGEVYLGLGINVQGNFHDFAPRIWSSPGPMGKLSLQLTGPAQDELLQPRIVPHTITLEDFDECRLGHDTDIAHNIGVDTCGQQIHAGPSLIPTLRRTISVPTLSILGTYAISFSVQMWNSTSPINETMGVFEALHRDFRTGFGVAFSASGKLLLYDASNSKTLVEGNVALPGGNTPVDIMTWVRLLPDAINITAIVSSNGKTIETMTTKTTNTGLLGQAFVRINHDDQFRPASAKLSNMRLHHQVISSLTDAVSQLQKCAMPNTVLSASSECKGLFDMPGVCRDLSNETINVIGQITDNFSNGTDAWQKDVLRPLLDSLQHLFRTGGKEYMESNFCAGSFKGADIASAPNGGALSQLYIDKCSKLPVNPDSEYTIFSTTLPGSLFLPLCPEIEGTYPAFAKEDISLCIAVSMCQDDLPTFGLALNKNLIGCILANPLIGVTTEGLSLLLSEAVEISLDSLAFGISASADFEQQITIFDGNQKTTAIAPANLAMTEELSFNSSKIGLPDILSLSITSMQLLSVFQDEVHFTKDVQNNNATQRFDELTSGFTLAITGLVQLNFGLKEITRGAFPDITFNLSSGTAFVTDAPKEVTNVEKGFYIFAQTEDLLASVIRGVVQSLLALVANIVDDIFGKGATQKLISHLSPDEGGDTLLGIAVNDDVSGLLLQFPIMEILETIPPFSILPIPSDFLGSLGIHVKVNHKTGSFSMKVDYIKGGFISAILDAEKWVIREAKEFFDETGKIIAVVLHKFVEEVEEAVDCVEHFFTPGSKCYIWNNYFIQETAKFFKELGDELEEELKEWVERGLKWCGTKWVVDIIECGAKDIKDGLVCGYDTIMSGVECGTEYVEDAAYCGTKYIEDIAICGADYITDGAKCGVETVTNGAECGFSYVEDFFKCIFGGDCSFKKPNTCSIPKSCKIARRCQVPNGCNINATCTVPKSCKVPMGCHAPIGC